MRRMRAGCLLAIVAFVTTSCGGSMTVPSNTSEISTSNRQSNDDGFVEAGQIDAVFIDRAALNFSETPMQGSVNGWPVADPKPNRAVASNIRVTQSYYGHADAGIGGLSIVPSDHSLTNIVAQHTIYHGAEGGHQQQLTLLKPGPTQIGDVLLYAPTMHSPNGSCLEAGVAYYNGGSFTNYQTHMYVYAYDFCGGPGHTFHPDTAPAWFSTYVRKSPDGFPEYTVQICNCTGPKIWSERFYNYNTKRFDTFYKTTGTYTGFGGGGWTQFETQFNVKSGSMARCSPNLPSVEESQVRFYSGRGVIYLNASNSKLYQPEPGENSFGAYGNCFNYSVTPASYRFTLPYGSNATWRVVSTGH